jgi:hypothetical protein
MRRGGCAGAIGGQRKAPTTSRCGGARERQSAVRSKSGAVCSRRGQRHIASTPAHGAQKRAASKNDWRPYNSIKSPLGQTQGGQSTLASVRKNAPELLPYLSFGTAQRSNRSRLRASLNSDRPGLPLSVFRRAGATTYVCADAAPNERARTPCRNSSGDWSISDPKAIVKVL